MKPQIIAEAVRVQEEITALNLPQQEAAKHAAFYAKNPAIVAACYGVLF